MSTYNETGSSGLGLKILQQSDFYNEASILHPVGGSPLQLPTAEARLD
jgi:hypothetical protein